MRVENIRIEESCGAPQRVRLLADVQYEARENLSEVFWLDFPEEMNECLSRSGDPWLVLLLPLAATLGEPLRIDAPVDRMLVRNAAEIVRVWRYWYPHLQAVTIEGDPSERDEPRSGRKSAAFFTGGVDSFFTVLSADGDTFGSAPRVTELLTVWGFDIGLEKRAVFRRLRATLRNAAAQLGKRLIDIASNVRETRFGICPWGELAHGAALASVALSMSARYEEVLLASSYTYGDRLAWGSHPLTDHLFSTSHTLIRHHGAAFSRLEKTRRIAASDIAMQSLRVCWRLGSDDNCGECDKCYRTMTTLHLLGALEKCTTFPKPFSLHGLNRVFLSPKSNAEEAFWQDLRTLAKETGHLDVARSISRGLKKGRSQLRRAHSLCRLRKVRLLRRLEQPLRRLLLPASST